MQPYNSKNGYCKKHQPKFSADGKKVDQGSCCSSCPGAKACGFVYNSVCCCLKPIIQATCAACNPLAALYYTLDCACCIVDFGCEFNCFTLRGCCGPKSCLGCTNCINPRFACAGTFPGTRYQRDKPGWASCCNPCSECGDAAVPSVECLEPGCKHHTLPHHSLKSGSKSGSKNKKDAKGEEVVFQEFGGVDQQPKGQKKSTIKKDGFGFDVEGEEIASEDLDRVDEQPKALPGPPTADEKWAFYHFASMREKLEKEKGMKAEEGVEYYCGPKSSLLGLFCPCICACPFDRREPDENTLCCALMNGGKEIYCCHTEEVPFKNGEKKVTPEDDGSQLSAAELEDGEKKVTPEDDGSQLSAAEPEDGGFGFPSGDDAAPSADGEPQDAGLAEQGPGAAE